MLKLSEIQSQGSRPHRCGVFPWQRTQRPPSKRFPDWLMAATL